MQRNDRRSGAAVRAALLVVLAVLALAAMIYYWKFAAPERQLSLTLTAFELLTEPDATRTPPLRESVTATVAFENGGAKAETISKARIVISSEEDLSSARSWSTTIHRDAVVFDQEVLPGQSISHTFVIPWTGRQETLYFSDDAKIHFGLSVVFDRGPETVPITLTERFGYVIQRDDHIAELGHAPLVLEIPIE